MRLGLARAHWINAALICALVPLLATRAAAQEPEPKPLVVHAELSIAYAKIPGGDSATVDPGLGFDLAGVFEVRDRWHFVLGFQHTRHKTTDSDLSMKVLQLFAEGRYMVKMSMRVEPYLFVRIATWHTASDIELFDDTNTLVRGHATQTGPSAGLGAGVLLTLTKRLQLYAAAGGQYLSLGDIDFDGYHVGSSSVSGPSVFVRTGLSVNFGPDGNVRR